jgi:hypothetical protein
MVKAETNLSEREHLAHRSGEEKRKRENGEEFGKISDIEKEIELQGDHPEKQFQFESC